MKEAGATTWRDAPAEEQQERIVAGGSKAWDYVNNAEKVKRRNKGIMTYAEENIDKETYIRETGNGVLVHCQ